MARSPGSKDFGYKFLIYLSKDYNGELQDLIMLGDGLIPYNYKTLIRNTKFVIFSSLNH